MMTFDATIDFEAPGLLESALEPVAKAIGPFEALTVIVRRDQEIAEVYHDNETFIEPLDAEDWCVTGFNVRDLTDQLRALL